MPKLNKTEIYKTNAKQAFFSGYQNYRNPLIWAIHTCLLPVTVGVGATVKTLIDVNTRYELSDEDMQAIKTQISNLSNIEFDQFVENIIKYQPRSNESIALKASLLASQENANQEVYQFEETLRQGLLQKKTININVDVPAIYKSYVFINRTPEITKQEASEMEKKVEQYTLAQAKIRRQTQRQAVLDYLDAEINIGKKLQHVIKDEVTNFTQSTPKLR